MFEAAAGFQAGFAARHDVAAHVLAQAFPVPGSGFAPRDMMPRAATPERPSQPRHFSPADPGHNPTAGWNPLDPQSEPVTGFVDPLAVAHAAGYAEGLAAATLAATHENTRDRQLIDGLVGELRSTDRFDREGVARQLRETVLFLVTRLVGEVGIAPDILAGRIAGAADLIGDSAESALLRVHPDDVALLDGRLPPNIFAAGDPSVARGSFVLETASTVVEDGPGLWLEQLAQAIDRVPTPSC